MQRPDNTQKPASYTMGINGRPRNINDLPNEMLSAIFRQVASQSDRTAAFYEIKALRATSKSFKALIKADPIIRAEVSSLLEETRAARSQNAMDEADNLAGRRTAGAIIAYHGVDDPVVQNFIRWHAATRDIKTNPDMVAASAITRNGVDDSMDQDLIRLQAAERDLRAGMDADAASKRNDVDPDVGYQIKLRLAREVSEPEEHSSARSQSL